MMMQTKIRWLNPLGVSSYDKIYADMLGGLKRQDTQLEIVSLDNDACQHHLEYHTYEGLIWSDIVRVARDTAVQKFDALVIGCFYDPALYEAREISGECVVVAPCESSVKIASSLGSKFSVIVGRQKWVPKMESTIAKYGYASKLASMRHVGMGVEDFHRDAEETSRRMTEAATRAVEEDGAEVIILGSTSEFGFYRKLQDNLKARFGVAVPVIDCGIAAFKYAEFLAETKVQNDWSPSRVNGSEAPPEIEELDRWKVFSKPVPLGNRVVAD
jgi:allantoin racemase